ncbi:MAG: S-layer homology domain-containing protein, partial [Oscillospiraceae bacterium]|nr:S-layer homology domain-containing protein [Oscillospiraceae bacterium]
DVSKPGEGGGTPTVTPSNPKPGDTVTVKPKPDSGYEVDKITVTDKNGKPVEVTVKPDGTYTFKQPSGKVTIEVSYKPIETPWNNPFADVSENDWYYEAVRFVQERGLMNGIGNGNFAPNAQLSCAQLAQILFNKEGRPGVNYLLTFSDVAGEAWYTEAIRWAASQGIVGGYGDGTFGPNDPITREQLAVMLWRYSGSPAATNKELYFNDTDEISGFALEALRWAVENGILNGYGDS